MRIAVVGAGSMGSIIGALIARGGLDVVLVDPNAEHIRAVNEKGLQIIGEMKTTIPVKGISPDNLDGIYDLIIYTPKATANPVALRQLLPHINERGTVITLQNGVNEDAVAAVVGRERTCGGIMLWGATLVGPGICELTSAVPTMSMVIGEIDGKITDRIQRIKEALKNVSIIEITPELMSNKWSKLYINAAFSGVGTVIGGDYGSIIDDDRAARVAAFVGMETIRTSKALDQARAKVLVFEPDALIFDSEERLNVILNIFRLGLKPHRAVYPSMLQDLEKGRPCEVEVINGYIEKKAREAGVKTPVNDQVTAIIRDIQAKKRTWTRENLKDIELPKLK